jgi:glycosyltransferase involved in cell wall biosynthesis
MKIAVWHNLPSGGGKRALYYQIKGLVARGHTVEAWCPSTADAEFLPLHDLIPEHVLPLNLSNPKPRTILRQVWSNYSRVVSQLSDIDNHCQTCAKQINQQDFDVLFANECRFYNASPIAHYVDIPRAFYLQEPHRRLYEARPDLPWIALPFSKQWSMRHIGQFIYNLFLVQGLRIQARAEVQNVRAFDLILANSLYSCESIRRVFGVNAQVCYLGVDTKLFVNRHQPREDFLIGIGAYFEEKNIHSVIKALAQVTAPRPRLVWVGNAVSEKYLDELRNLARSLGVDFLPRIGVNDTEIVDLMNRAAMMVYVPHLEPFGFAPLEANACGLPVIALAEAGLRETMIDGLNSILVEDNPLAMARAIDDLRTHSERARELGEQGSRRVVQEWTWDVAVGRLESHLKQLVESG